MLALVCQQLIVLAIIAIVTADICQIHNKESQINGVLKLSRRNKPFCSFLGIQYAQAPVGELRFKESVPFDFWKQKNVSVVKDPSPCIQKNFMRAGAPVYGSENCLFVNVHSQLKTMRPVMVYIHGGGFFSGSGLASENGPEYFMDKDIVLVTINYRLGILGFLGDEAGYGNWGLKDQVLALKWVQKNIGFFKGDKNRVTIFGQSAGAASVHYHMLSKHSTNLFHKAISQSGSANALWGKTITPDIMNQTKSAQVRFLNCTRDSPKKEIDCLRKKNVIELVESTKYLKFWDIEPITIYIPMIEVYNSSRSFIDRDVLDILKNGNIPNKVPWMIGNVANEGCIRVSSFEANPTLMQYVNENLDTNVPNKLFGFGYSLSTRKVKLLWELIKNYYQFEKLNSFQNKKAYLQAYGDRFFTYPIFQAVELHAQQNHKQIYLYKFNYRSKDKLSYATVFANLNSTQLETPEFKEIMGVCHCDDLIYLFKNTLFENLIVTNRADIKMSRLMVSRWTAFARNDIRFT